MKKMNLPQAICAVLGLAAVLLLPYYSFRFLGINYFNISAIGSVGGMYPILLVPVVGMLLLAILGLTEYRNISMAAGGVLLVVQVLLAVLRVSVVFTGDISFLTNQLAALIENLAGMSANIDVRMLVSPMLKPGLGFYVGLCLNLVYLVLGAIPLGSSSGSGSSNGRRNFDSKNSANQGRRSF